PREARRSPLGASRDAPRVRRLELALSAVPNRRHQRLRRPVRSTMMSAPTDLVARVRSRPAAGDLKITSAEAARAVRDDAGAARRASTDAPRVRQPEPALSAVPLCRHLRGL